MMIDGRWMKFQALSDSMTGVDSAGSCRSCKSQLKF